MGNPPLIVGLLIRRFTNAAVWRVFVVVSLFVAAGLYVVFALRAGEGTLWVVAEVVGVAIFGGMGLVGLLFGSIWWIVAGWALHPLWDVGLHFLGPGRSFAPETYTMACLSFDVLVAAYIAITYARRRGR